MHSSCFLSRQLHFLESFTSEKTIGGYFDSNACTHFQKIYDWTKYETIALKMLIFEVFYLSKNHWRLRSMKCVQLLPENMYWNKVRTFENCLKNKIFFGLHNNVKNANFWGLFPSIKTIGDYSQWNACTHFQ